MSSCVNLGEQRLQVWAHTQHSRAEVGQAGPRGLLLKKQKRPGKWCYDDGYEASSVKVHFGESPRLVKSSVWNRDVSILVFKGFIDKT